MKRILQNSPVEIVKFRGVEYFIKRDDLLDKDFSGNKARKLLYLLEIEEKGLTLISRGSILSNAMFSLSVLAKLKGWRFIYFAHHLIPDLVKHPIGNLKAALENGMKLKEKRFSSKKEFEKFVENNFKTKTIIVDEGGREKEAEFGIELLGEEILDWAKRESRFNNKIFLPSGTGTTALFLQKFFLKNQTKIEVFTTPCVGGQKYLLEQFRSLEKESKFYPKILTLEKNYRFGKLYFEFYKVWLELQKSTKIEFDLLYDPLGWIVVDFYKNLLGKYTLYIHQGGVLGNESMLLRYKKKYKIGERF